MAAHVHVDIVEVEGVGGGAVYKRRLARWGAEAMPEDGRFSRATLVADHIRSDTRGILAATGEHHAKRVEDRAARLFTSFSQDVARRCGGDEFGEAPCDLHGGILAQGRTSEAPEVRAVA
jgi:hypothetical protein